MNAKPKKQATVKPISAHDEKTLDSAIALANEITTRLKQFDIYFNLIAIFA